MKFLAIVLLTQLLALAHRPVNLQARPLIIAHRGASHDAPENTLAAFRLAWEQGADGIEADFYLTSDDRIVCNHDETTERTAGVDLRIADVTFDQLRRLDVGSWKGSRWANERMPLIEQVLAMVPKRKKIYIEVKCGPEIVPMLQRALAKSGLTTHQIVVISFRQEVIAEVKQSMRGVKAFWLVAYRKDEENNRWLPSVEQIMSTLEQCKADGLGSEANRDVVSADMVEMLRGAGFELHTWTVDEPKAARYFQSLGVDSIITNRPAFLRKQLDANAAVVSPGNESAR